MWQKRFVSRQLKKVVSPQYFALYIEYLIQETSRYYDFENHLPGPVNGMLELPDRPGFGIQLDESRIADIRSISWQQN